MRVRGSEGLREGGRDSQREGRWEDKDGKRLIIITKHNKAVEIKTIIIIGNW